MDHPPDHVQIWAPPPGHPLEPYVTTIFRVRRPAAVRHEIILPKANVDLIFNLGTPMQVTGVSDAPRLAGEGDAWLGGLKMRPFVALSHGAVDVVGVSLRGEACAGLLPLSPGEIVNQDVQGLPDAAGLRLIGEQLHDLRTFAEQRALLVRWLAARLRPPRGADAVRHACTLLRTAGVDGAVRTTARALAVSPRHLRRMVGEHVGIGPAEYVRLARFVQALRRMEAPGQTLTQVAYACGYYDQAHFCRDFRSFAEMTPQEYRSRANGPTAGHIVIE